MDTYKQIRNDNLHRDTQEYVLSELADTCVVIDDMLFISHSGLYQRKTGFRLKQI
jgi:hypothetical protein